MSDLSAPGPDPHPHTHLSTERFPVPPGSIDDQDTAVGVLAALRDEGVIAEFNPGREPATVHCGGCDSTSPGERFEVVAERRLEGASDPDEMVLIVAARCPVCHISGALVLGYGPEASATDADLVAALGP